MNLSSKKEVAEIVFFAVNKEQNVALLSDIYRALYEGDKPEANRLIDSLSASLNNLKRVININEP